MQNCMNKVFIIGLPRTGTTSACSKCLELGFTVAHTAYTQKTFEQAQVIADTPIFNDFKALDTFYPNSKYILLTRESGFWVPSIKQLLARMHHNIVRTDGGFNPYIKRCYQTVFSPFTLENISDDNFLLECYEKHKNSVMAHFINRKQDLLTIDISQEKSLIELTTFLGITTCQMSPFEKMNMGGKVTAWKDLVNERKIESTHNGRISKLAYLAE